MKKIYIFILVLFFSLNFSACYNDNSDSITWTLMVYANADNDLEPWIVADIKELELADISYRKLRVVVLLDRIKGYSDSYGDWSGARLFEISHNPDINTFSSKELSSEELGLSPAVLSQELNMGDPQTLSRFISFCKKKYYSDYYSLMIEGHGNGWYTESKSTKSISPDKSSFFSSISPAELKSVLAENKVDVLSMDACLMGSLEVVYELRNCVDYIISSPQSLPSSGFNYKILVEKLFVALDSPDVFSKEFAPAFEEGNPSYSDLVMRYDTKEISQMSDSNIIDNFIAELKKLPDSELINYRKSLKSYSYNSNKVYVDLYDAAIKLNMLNLISMLDNAIIGNGESKSISIYWPETKLSYESNYQFDLDFTKSCNWDAFLKYYYAISPL